MQTANFIQQAVTKAVDLLNQGEVIAYPTEAVYGLGCNPFDENAVKKLFHVKHRPYEKGVIMVAASVAQITDLVALEGEPWQTKVEQSWPGPVTWVLPIKTDVPDWITGGRDSVAIRVSDHPTVQALCKAYGGPIVSTSANISGQEPARSAAEVNSQFANEVFCIDAPLGSLAEPTQIWDARSQKQLR